MIVLSMFTCLLLSPPALAENVEFRGSGAPVMGDVPTASGRALFKFDFGYEASDHHVAQLGILQRPGRSPQLFLADKDGREPVSGSMNTGELPVAPDTPMVEFTKTCKSGFSCSFRVQNSAFARNYVFALAGFKFKNLSGQDTHVKKIAIAPSSDGQFVLATFGDTGTNFEVEITIQGYLVPLFSPSGILIVRTQSWHGRAVNEGDHPSTSMSAGARAGFLRGFRIWWDNDDHHLARFSLEITPERVKANLRDHSGFDPYTVQLFWGEILQ